jgi:hypothetical protein
MIGALPLGFAAFEAGCVGFGGVWRGQICGVGDMVRDTGFVDSCDELALI